ncbi:MAG: pinensin family lanthipeptide [Cyclobacteriaceae bacterium]
MRKKKLKLDELKVKSFVTLTEEDETNTVKAGLRNTVIDIPQDPIKNPLDTALCAPTPGTWCYYCPVEF